MRSLVSPERALDSLTCAPRNPLRRFRQLRVRATATKRNPLLLRLSGAFLLRFAERKLLALLFHEPPRVAVFKMSNPATQRLCQFFKRDCSGAILRLTQTQSATCAAQVFRSHTDTLGQMPNVRAMIISL